MRFSLLLIFAFFASSSIFAQSDDALIVNKEKVIIDSIEAKPVKIRKPGNALKWAIIPGGGQVYNKAWWKVPLVYGALLGSIGVADFNTTNYRRFVVALEAECFGEDIPVGCEPTDHEFTGLIDGTNALVSLRNQFDKNRQTSYIFILVTYLLQGIEAYSDAHLKTFDVDEDLSIINLKPVMLPGSMPGIGVSIPLGLDRSRLRQEAFVKRR